MRRSRPAGLVLALLIGAAGGWGSAAAEDAPPPPPSPVFERLFPSLKERAAALPPFPRDTNATLHLRTFYLNRARTDSAENEASAFGGWLGYRSGWLLDTFAIGATFYGSAPLYAPQDRDGTLLLKPGQEGYYVPGEAWAAVRYQDLALLKGYRQLIDQPYISAQDSRMTPNTFEAVTLGGKAGWVEYLGGYLWNIKTRNSDDFVAMSSAAGVKRHHDGVGLAGVRLSPLAGLRIDASNQYGINTFNTLYAAIDYLHSFNDDWKVRLGAQLADQRAVGDALVAKAADRYWATQVGGARVRLSYRGLALTGAFSITGAGNTIQSPWGDYPGYLSLIDQDFDRANEKAWLVGAAYDFSTLADTGVERILRLCPGPECHQPRHAGQRAESEGVRLNGGLPSSLAQSHLRQRTLVSRPRRHPRPGKRQETRLPVSPDPQLGKEPALNEFPWRLRERRVRVDSWSGSRGKKC